MAFKIIKFKNYVCKIKGGINNGTNRKRKEEGLCAFSREGRRN